VTITEAFGNFLDRNAILLFFTVPIGGETRLCNRLPFMRPIDMFKPDVFSSLIRIRNCVNSNFPQSL